MYKMVLLKSNSSKELDIKCFPWKYAPLCLVWRAPECNSTVTVTTGFLHYFSMIHSFYPIYIFALIYLNKSFVELASDVR